jgi:hypothetical protein
MREASRARQNAGIVLVSIVAVAFAFATATVLAPTAALAEDNNPNPPPPKPKDPPPPPDPCARDRMRSACRNAEAVRNLLREPPPMDPKPAVETGTGATTVQ